MLKQNFDLLTLKSCLRKKDFGIHHLRFKSQELLDEAIIDICYEANRDDYSILSIKSCFLRGKPTYSLSSLTDNLVARRINNVLKRVYKVKQANRSAIIKQISALLSESTPYSIIRTDIKDFYESIAPKEVLDKIGSDGIISSKILDILNRLYAPQRGYAGNGLRRGLGISATLSEMHMRQFDKLARNASGVFFYARYVDDIVIFTIGDAKSLLNRLADFLPNGLKLNKDKTKIIYIPCKDAIEDYHSGYKCNKESSCPKRTKSISFLGYNLEFVCHKNNKQTPKQVHIGIARKKIKKIKTRIARSLIDHSHTGNYSLLKKRIQFLTGNYKLDSRTRRGKLFSGIYYNYPLLTAPYSDLQNLDRFLRKAIFSNHMSYSGHYTLTTAEKTDLKKFSFLHGHNQRFSRPFKASEIEDIKRCWMYE